MEGMYFIIFKYISVDESINDMPCPVLLIIMFLNKFSVYFLFYWKQIQWLGNYKGMKLQAITCAVDKICRLFIFAKRNKLHIIIILFKKILNIKNLFMVLNMHLYYNWPKHLSNLTFTSQIVILITLFDAQFLLSTTVVHNKCALELNP